MANWADMHPRRLNRVSDKRRERRQEMGEEVEGWGGDGRDREVAE